MKKKIIRILVCILFFGANVFPCISGIKNIEVKKVNNFPKFFSDGFEWAISAGGSYIDKGLDISLDSNGNIYVTGEFHNTVTFGNYTITSNGNYDVFVAKLIMMVIGFGQKMVVVVDGMKVLVLV